MKTEFINQKIILQGRILLFGIPSMLILYILLNAERNGLAISKNLAKIGDRSYSIYLSHLLTLNAAGRIWQKFSLDTIYDNIVVLPLLVILTIVVGILSYTFVEKPLLLLSRKIA